MRYISILLVFGVSFASAQDLQIGMGAEKPFLAGAGQVAESNKAENFPEESRTEVVAQNSATLDSKQLEERSGEGLPELDSLREKSLYHTFVSMKGIPVSWVDDSRLGSDLQRISAAYRRAGEQGADCPLIALSVGQRVRKAPESVLEIVDRELRANPGCSCEIVKAAIKETDKQVPTVVAIVKTAFFASPEHMRLIAQCAIAACPEALSAVQALLAKYEKTLASGDSAKSAKGGDEDGAGSDDGLADGDEVAATPNPLDFPGGPEGFNLNFIPPPLLIVTPSGTTIVDP